MGKREYDKQALSPVILAEIASGKSLREVCRADGMPSEATFRGWVTEDAELAAQYARAMSARADVIFDEILEIADRAKADDVQCGRLQIDARKWMLGKMNPKKYGEKIDHNHSGGVTVNITGDDAKL